MNLTHRSSIRFLACSTAAAMFMSLAQADPPSNAVAPAAPPPTTIEYPEGPSLKRPAMPLARDGNGVYWSAEDLLKSFGGDVRWITSGTFAATPEYRLDIVQRPHVAPEKADAEMHEDHTQIYFILSGTGTQVLGGKPASEAGKYPDGHHSARGTLHGGISYKIKAGDIVLIPPSTWHQTLPNAGETVSYYMMHIYTRRRLP